MREAREVEAQAVALVAATTLPHAQRAHLQRARLLLLEAEALLREGEIVAARERASLSQAELRHGPRPRARGGGAIHFARAGRDLAALDRGDARVVALDRPARDPGPEGEERSRAPLEGRAGAHVRRRGGLERPRGQAAPGRPRDARGPLPHREEEGPRVRAATTARSCSTTRTKPIASASPRRSGAGRSRGGRGSAASSRSTATAAAGRTGRRAAWPSPTATSTTSTRG